MLIGKRVLEEEVVEGLVTEIIKKKELRNLSGEFVRDILYLFLNSNPRAAAFLSGKPNQKTSLNKKSSRYKSIIKQVRAKLRKFYGQYRGSADAQRIHELVERLLQGRIVDQHILRDILMVNASTRERLPFYEELYEKLFQITGSIQGTSSVRGTGASTTMPTTIIDLGCGLNPFSIPWMYAPQQIAKLRYYAYDINEDEIAALGEFFEYLHSRHPDFQGKAEVLDALHLEELLDLPPANLCFLWKMTDVLDRGKGHRATEAVIKAVPARWVVVSFPTKTLSGKRMNVPEKKWVELLCRRLGYGVTVLKFPTEVFYVIKK